MTDLRTPETPELEKLRELAEKATPGPWKALVHGTANQEQAALLALNSVLATSIEDNPDIKFTDMAWVDIEDGRHVALIGNGPVGPENAHYIAAVSPDVVLRLLSRLQAAEREVERYRAALETAKAGLGSVLWLANNIHNAGAAPIQFREFFDAATEDVRRAYDELGVALSEGGQ